MSVLYKILIFIYIFITLSCVKIFEKNLIKKEELIIKKISDNECSKIFTEEDVFDNLLPEMEKYIFESKLIEYKLIPSDDIYKKYDVSNDLLIHINEVEKNNKIRENKYFKTLKKELIHEKSILEDNILLESHIYSKEFSESIKKLNIDSNSYPLLHSLNNSEKSLELFNKNKNSKSKVFIKDIQDFNNIKNFTNFIDKHTFHLKEKFNKNNFANLSQPTIGLSHAFLIKNIIDYFKEDNNNNEEDNTINKIIKIHIYANLTQIFSDVIDSGIKTAHIIEILKTNDLQSIRPFQSFSKISSRINIFLNIFNVVFDAIELNYANTNQELIKYRTQFAFDTTSTTLMGSGIILGETTAGIFLSTIGEIIGGLSVGFTAYAEVIGDVTEIALKNAKYFLEYENNHSLILQGNNYYPDSNETTISFAHKNFIRSDNGYKSDHLDIVIEEIDLTENGFYKITFGDHLTPPITRWKKDAKYYHPFDENPKMNLEAKEYIKLRESLNINKKNNFELKKIQKIILPNQAQYLIHYNFISAPFFVNRNDSFLKSVNKIQSNSPFLFRYTFFPAVGSISTIGDRAIGDMKFNTKETNINIKLNENNKNMFFLTPTIPDDFKNKIKYNFEILNENNNEILSYYLLLSENAKYEINSAAQTEFHFYINDKFKNSYFNENTNILSIQNNDNQKINIEVKFNSIIPSNIFVHDITGVAYLTYKSGNTTPIISYIDHTINAKNFENNEEIFNKIDEFIKNTEYSINYQFKFIKIINFKNEINNNTETIFYDIKNNKYIYSKINDEHLDIIGMIKENYIFKSTKHKIIKYNTGSEFHFVRYDEYNIKNSFIIKKNTNNQYVLYELTENGTYLKETSFNNIPLSNLYGLVHHNNHNKFNNLNYILDLNNIESKVNNSIKLNIDNTFTKSKLLDIVRITEDNNKNKTKLFYIPSKKRVIDIKDEKSKIIKYFKNHLNEKYYFISSKNKTYLFKFLNNGDIQEKQFDFLTINIALQDNEIILESDGGKLYSLDKNNDISLLGLNELWLKINKNNDLNSELQKITSKFESIYVFINEFEYAEYYLNENKLLLFKNKKFPVGESKSQKDTYYFYDTVLNKIVYTNKNYINPRNFKIIENNDKTISLQFNQNKVKWRSINDENDLIHIPDQNKKMAFMLNHLFK